MLTVPDEYRHNNPNNAYTDSNAVRGGTRSPVNNLAELYALVQTKSDLMKEWSTRLRVISEGRFYMLTSLANAGNATGWLKEAAQTSLGVERKVADIAARNALGPNSDPPLQDQENVYVIDATGDPTVASGWAIYKWLEGIMAWLKVAEGESIDVNFNKYAEKAGATFTGPLLAPTPAATENSTRVPTTAWVNSLLKISEDQRYNAGTVYNVNSQPVISDNRFWQYINPTPAAGQTPAENAYWTEVSPTNIIFSTQPELTAETIKTKPVSPWGLGQWFTNKVLTGLATGTNAVIAATDTVLGAFAKLQAQLNNKLSTTLANGQLLIGNAGNVATGRTPIGDVLIDNLGNTTIGDQKVQHKMYQAIGNMTALSNMSGNAASPQANPLINLIDGAQMQLVDTERGIERWASGTLFKQTSDKTVANTIARTSLISLVNKIGTNVLPAGAPFVGDEFVYTAHGIISVANGTDTLNLQVDLGAVTIAQIGATLMGTLTNAAWHLEVTFTVRSLGANGTVSASGFMLVDDYQLQMPTVDVSTIDFTSPKTLDLFATWSNALVGHSIKANRSKLKID